MPFTRVFVATPGSDAPPRPLTLTGSASTLAWSPVGNRLLVVLAPTPLVDDDLMMRRVHVVDVDTGGLVTTLDNPGKLGQVAWSPDARHIAMVSGQDINDPAAGRLLVGAATGGALADVLPNYLGHVSAIAFRSADTIAFVGDQGVETVLGEVSVDGSGRRTVVAAGTQILSASNSRRTVRPRHSWPTRPRTLERCS